MSATGAVDLSAREPAQAAPDISVVMPCLNEAGSVGTCIEMAWEGIRKTGLTGEVVVSDNGSTDDSVAVATRAGARVVRQPERGYGNAYLQGLRRGPRAATSSWATPTAATTSPSSTA